MNGLLDRMRSLKDLFTIIRHLWSARREGDGSREDSARRTEAMMSELGFDTDEPVGTPPYSDAACEQLASPEFDALYPNDFTLTAAHLALLRKSRLAWASGETIAPGLHEKTPFVGGQLPELLSKLLGTSDEKRHVEFLISLPAAYATFFAEAKLPPGDYAIGNLRREECDALVEEAHEVQLSGGELSHDGTFRIDDEVIKVLPALSWEWPDEDDMDYALDRGRVLGPVVDTKRPFGDMTYYALDIHRVLGWQIEVKNEEGAIELSDAQEEAASRLHARVLFAAQVFLEHASHPAES